MTSPSTGTRTGLTAAELADWMESYLREHGTVAQVIHLGDAADFLRRYAEMEAENKRLREALRGWLINRVGDDYECLGDYCGLWKSGELEVHGPDCLAKP